MKSVFLFIFLFIVWMIISFNLKAANIIVGIIASLITSLLFSKYLKINVSKAFQPQRYFWAIMYLLVFIWECIKANFDVAYRVLHPAMPIKPGIIKAKTTLKTQLAKSILANSITMTPGTITVDVIGENLFIHWIYVSSKDPNIYNEIVLGRFERYIKRIFE